MIYHHSQDSHHNLPPLVPYGYPWGIPISLFPNILTFHVSLNNDPVRLISTSSTHIDMVIISKERTSRKLPQNKDMLFCPPVIKCQETPSLLWFLKSTSLPCCNFVIVTLFLVVIAGYTCTKWDTLTSEDDLCTSILRDLTDVTKLANRYIYLFVHFEVSHVVIFTGLTCVHL